MSIIYLIYFNTHYALYIILNTYIYIYIFLLSIVHDAVQPVINKVTNYYSRVG